MTGLKMPLQYPVNYGVKTLQKYVGPPCQNSYQKYVFMQKSEIKKRRKKKKIFTRKKQPNQLVFTEEYKVWSGEN